ncbi:hypothetical protein [Macrococcoides caseolyticum]|nr:hypothetical protein [Macrococcus caseolyticus]
MASFIIKLATDLSQDRYYENRIRSGRRPLAITGTPFGEWAD